MIPFPQNIEWGEREERLADEVWAAVRAELTFAVGERVTWIHVPRGGYGYVFPVDGEVLRVTPKRVQIRVALQSGEIVERLVRPESLRKRTPT